MFLYEAVEVCDLKTTIANPYTDSKKISFDNDQRATKKWIHQPSDLLKLTVSDLQICCAIFKSQCGIFSRVIGWNSIWLSFMKAGLIAGNCSICTQFQQRMKTFWTGTLNERLNMLSSPFFTYKEMCWCVCVWENCVIRVVLYIPVHRLILNKRKRSQHPGIKVWTLILHNWVGPKQTCNSLSNVTHIWQSHLFILLIL